MAAHPSAPDCRIGAAAGDRASDDYMPVFDHALQDDNRTKRKDVPLTVEIRHREGYNRPLDECEERCLHEMVAKLRPLGAQDREWSDTQARVAQIARH